MPPTEGRIDTACHYHYALDYKFLSERVASVSEFPFVILRITFCNCPQVLILEVSSKCHCTNIQEVLLHKCLATVPTQAWNYNFPQIWICTYRAGVNLEASSRLYFTCLHQVLFHKCPASVTPQAFRKRHLRILQKVWFHEHLTRVPSEGLASHASLTYYCTSV
jgi:hypothetical protein